MVKEINKKLKKEIYEVLPWWDALTVKEIYYEMDSFVEIQTVAALLRLLEFQGFICKYVDKHTHIAYYSRKHLFKRKVD